MAKNNKTVLSLRRALMGACVGAGALASMSAAANAAMPDITHPTPGQTAFLDIYREMVETDTSITTGSCTALAGKVAARLSAAGYADSQIIRFGVPDHPKEGGLVAILPGTNPKLKAVLLLGHIDVVTAKREDWTRDPYKMIDEGGYVYGRGTTDMKVLDAIWLDMLIRFRKENYRPARTIKMALTCGEETAEAFNGAQYLAKNRRELIDAAFALNEGGGGLTDGKGLSEGGHLAAQTVQVGEKAYQDYTLSVTNPGGHSSVPVPDNAIARMARALDKVNAYEFPMQFNATTRAFFTASAPLREGALGKAMLALVANPADSQAEAEVNTDRQLHSMLRTTCVPTMIEGGHALNALPQRVTANVNCRMLPGRTWQETQDVLAKVIGDDAVHIEPFYKDKPIAVPPPMDPAVITPMRNLVARYFPGVPFIPVMTTGATDGVYLEAANIPTYGVPGSWTNPDFNHIHGLNERMELASAYMGRDFLTDLVKAYTAR